MFLYIIFEIKHGTIKNLYLYANYIKLLRLFQSLSVFKATNEIQLLEIN